MYQNLNRYLIQLKHNFGQEQRPREIKLAAQAEACLINNFHRIPQGDCLVSTRVLALRDLSYSICVKDATILVLAFDLNVVNTNLTNWIGITTLPAFSNQKTACVLSLPSSLTMPVIIRPSPDKAGKNTDKTVSSGEDLFLKTSLLWVCIFSL